MRLRILDSALEDLDQGRIFYERQGEGLGAYFLDSLFAEIDSLVLYAGIHWLRPQYTTWFQPRITQISRITELLIPDPSSVSSVVNSRLPRFKPASNTDTQVTVEV